jgi:outer membrane protein OmpA-like peptidoglycan-associated protein
MRNRGILSAGILALLWGPSHAGWFEDAVKGALEGAGRRGVHETVDDAYKETKGKAKESVKPGDSPAPAEGGQASDAQPSAMPAGKAPGTATAPAADVAGAPDIAAAEQIYSKYDFVPGDRVIFFDDFSDTEVGEFPRKWTLQGPGAGTSNAVEVVRSQERNFLRSQPAADKGDSQYYSRQYVRLDTKGDLPEKFTVEFDAVFAYCPPGAKNSQTEYVLLLANKNTSVHGGNASPGSIVVRPEEGMSRNTRTAIRKGDGKVHHVAVSVNGTFVKAYVDQDRVANDPDGIPRPIQHVGIFMGSTGHWLCPSVMFTNFRLAEGGKNIQSALDTDGKIVTHGILFDTGSDRIRPESLPTLKTILGLLEKDASLKFSVEGHTDNQGGQGINQPLSERRAAAVKAWLEGKGIPADRLRSKGWGDTKSVDRNDTPEGRANNRRVEFVKIG